MRWSTTGSVVERRAGMIAAARYIPVTPQAHHCQKVRREQTCDLRMKIRLFENSSDFVVLPAGHVIFNAGDPGDKMYAVIGGAVDIIVRGQVIETVESGGIFGEMALVEDRPRSASAVVKTEAKVVAIDKNRFLFMVQQTPFFSLQLLTIVTDRLRRLIEKV